MALDRDTTFTWYGHACFEVRTPGGQIILIDPWFGNPQSPRTADSVERCDLLLVTHGHGDHMGDAVALASRLRPAWPCMHEMSLWLARRLPGRRGRGDRDEQGRDGRGGRHQGHDDPRRPLGRRLERRAARRPSTSASRSASSSSSRTASASTTRATPTSFGDMRLIRELYRPDLAFLPIGGHYTMGPREAALAVELLGVKHVVPIHYGTFPILAGTPAAWRPSWTARGLTDVEIHAPEPGGSVS